MNAVDYYSSIRDTSTILYSDKVNYPFCNMCGFKEYYNKLFGFWNDEPDLYEDGGELID